MHRPTLSDLRAPFRGDPASLLAYGALVGLYVGAAKLGISLSVAEGVITPVWAPSGIALAALLILGLRFWPAVAVGAFVANATSGATLLEALGISVGNTLEAVVGALLVARLGFSGRLDRVRGVLALVVGGAILSTLIAATNGVSVLALAGDVDDYGSAWLLWWFGDAVGDLMVAPLILTLWAARGWRPTSAEALEGGVLLAALVGVSAVVFLAGGWRYPYLVFPLLIWAPLRFRELGAAVAAFVVGALGTWGAVIDEVPIASGAATERVQVAQALFALVAASLLVVGATLSEREAGRTALERAAASLGEAQALAHIGSWQWDIAADTVTWSDELYRIFGLPQGTPVNYGSYLERIHPDDRQFVNDAVQAAYTDRLPFSFEHRIVRPDGGERAVASRGRVLADGDDPVAMLGTAQDVTEQRQVERLREDILSAVSHELRTPLTSVLGFALTLERRRKELAETEIETIVAELGRAAKRLERLLADLLDVERIRRGLGEARRRETEIREVVERIVAACPLDGRQLRVVGGPLLANVDPAKVERIVENLIVNAVKHTEAGSSIEVRLEGHGTDLLLVVEDDGPGVPDEFKEDVFETFNRGEKMHTATPGTGIGLALVARFAAVHGGRSWVEDRPGGGASFRVLLPDCLLPTPEAAIVHL